jgi:hypothetical protein
MVKIKSIGKTLILIGIFGIASLQFSGCSAAHTAIKKRNLDVQTKMSETIFLEPTEPQNRVVFVDIRNTSDKEINLKESIITALVLFFS